MIRGCGTRGYAVTATCLRATGEDVALGRLVGESLSTDEDFLRISNARKMEADDRKLGGRALLDRSGPIGGDDVVERGLGNGASVGLGQLVPHIAEVLRISLKGDHLPHGAVDNVLVAVLEIHDLGTEVRKRPRSWWWCYLRPQLEYELFGSDNSLEKRGAMCVFSSVFRGVCVRRTRETIQVTLIRRGDIAAKREAGRGVSANDRQWNLIKTHS